METWTTRRLLQWTTQRFADKHIHAPRVAAEMLLAHVLDVPRLRLYMEPQRPADEAERQRFRDLVQRALRHEPVDYLIGRTPFFSMELSVSPAVLIPRPSTETIVEHVLQHARLREVEGPLTVADLCTGSGAVAIALAKHLPAAQIIATDLSAEALAVARDNARQQDVEDRITWRQGDLYAPLDDERFDYLLANPPYISDAQWEQVASNVKDYEPETALRSGVDGLDHLRPMIAGAGRWLRPGGQCLFEIAASQSDAVLGLARDAQGLADGRILRDHEKLPRVLLAEAASSR